MQYIITILLVLIYTTAIGQQNFLNHWKKVESFENKGLTQSALEEVRKVYDEAVTANNTQQQLKAVMYILKFRSLVEIDNSISSIQYLDTLIDKNRFPAKNILLSMQAALYQQYLDENRWRISNRTNVTINEEDIKSWSIDKLNEKITTCYLLSIANENRLKEIKITEFSDIIEKGENTANLRPTLFDLLAFRALDYFISDINYISKPAYSFVINNERFFAPVHEFIQMNVSVTDTSSLQYKAVKLLQELLAFHYTAGNIAALIDADLIRLKFMYEHAAITEKEAAYEDALIQLEKKYPENPVLTEAMYIRAQLHLAAGEKNNKKKETAIVTSICEKAIELFPESAGAIKCFNLMQELKSPKINVEAEQAYLPSLPIKILVKYKNTPLVYFRIVPTKIEEVYSINNDESKFWQQLKSRKAVANWEQSLPGTEDYLEHAAEVKVDGLPPGMYVLMLSTNKEFNYQTQPTTRIVITVTSIAVIKNNRDNFLVNRATGKPLYKANVEIIKPLYDYERNEYTFKKVNYYLTDANGYFKVTDSGIDGSFITRIKYGTDEWISSEQYINQFNRTDTANLKSAYLFTDRSVYRPGQILYFKGIVFSSNANSTTHQPVPNIYTTVILRNANGDKVSSLTLKTNEYGSYAGSFILPQGELKGYYSITDSVLNTTQSISVETYKRPKFFVTVATPRENYRLNDTIRVSGNAIAYAGNKIVNSKVSYKIGRQAQYNPMYNYSSWPPLYNNSTPIANGSTTTNQNGEFTIPFKAIPDESFINENTVFNYTIDIDVTDINGETQSKTLTISVAKYTIQLYTDMDSEVFIDTLQKIKIVATNTNGLPTKTIATVKIFQLATPFPYRKRYWQTPDQFTMSKEVFNQLFPYDAYSNEDEVKNYAIIKKVWEKTDSTSAGLWNLEASSWEPGWYKVVISAKDYLGQDATMEKFVSLLSINNNRKTILQAYASKNNAAIGEKIRIQALTGLNECWVIQQISTTGSKNTEVITLNADKKNEKEWTITSLENGGIHANYICVKNNRVYTTSVTIAVPWKNKKLKINYETFRNKLEPGSKEEWKLSIKGNNSEKVSCELLASMYDASLDQIKPHRWPDVFNIWPVVTPVMFESIGFGTNSSNTYYYPIVNLKQIPAKTYFSLATYFLYYSNRFVAAQSVAADKTVKFSETTGNRNEMAESNPQKKDISDEKIFKSDKAKGEENNRIKIRKDFNETAFFFPQLTTNNEGEINFSFKMPEALTEWKMQLLAHNSEMATAMEEQKVITQKELMVQPNLPRFVRQGDKMEVVTKVVNLSDKELSGMIQMELFDAANNKNIDGWLKNIFPVQYFTITPGQTQAIQFPVEIPVAYTSALGFRFKASAQSGNIQFTDGEESAVPVLSNRLLVTESLPLNIRKQTEKDFKFNKLLNSNSSSTLTHQSFVLEYSSNPTWYVVQALPYLFETKNESVEQIAGRLYANSLSAYISSKIPGLQNTFNQWKIDSSSVVSSLSKNEELKYVLLKETPWILDAADETTQHHNISMLFNAEKMQNETTNAINKLLEYQNSNGSFVWFKGGYDDYYMTQNIITTLGHLKHIGAMPDNTILTSIIEKGIQYVDGRMKRNYDELIKSKVNLNQNNLSYLIIQYLYMRSFFNYTLSEKNKKAFDYYSNQINKYWLKQSKYMQAMIAITLFRSGNKKTPIDIIRSLRENAIYDEEMGMYWKDIAAGGYYWYQAPIEAQALIIEAFQEIENNTEAVNDLRTWLLKQKQTNHWYSSKATADACYALLLNKNTADTWLNNNTQVTISAGNISVSNNESSTVATGYFKKSIQGNKVKQGMGNIHVSIKNASPASTSWGAAYWQYFEELDKITAATSPLTLTKKIFVEKQTNNGGMLQLLTTDDELHIGDKIKIRIIIKTDRDFEYVHLQDYRASALEPVNNISGYHYQDGLGYYQSTGDAATDFFFHRLPRGTYVFEYPLLVAQNGNFSNGISTIQCLYAPDFGSHSESSKIKVSKKNE